jgi:predicted DNA-binding protein (MmcQ/YjbR family)
VSCSFKTISELFTELTTKEGIIPAPYMARNMWVQVDDINRLTMQEWIEYSTTAYQLVFDILPAKTKKLLAGV